MIGTGEPDEFECWQINWLAFRVFQNMSTQWNVITGRAIGLRYESLPWVLQAGGVNKKEHAQLLQDLRVMEQAALKIFNKS